MGGRVLIALTALLIAVSPWTEYYWNFDNFFHGGQDFEFGLLATITVFCLVLVLLQQGQQIVTFLLALQRWLSVEFHDPDPSSVTLPFRSALALIAVPLPSPPLGVCDCPLRI